MKKSSTYLVILAGGKGERLWPLSREKKPKQLLPFTNEDSLLEHTIERIKSLVPKDNLWIVTNELQAPHIENLVGTKVGKILAEPASCNTAPALLYSCLKIFQKDENALITFLPADHFIVQDKIFRKSLTDCLDFCAQNNGISLVGLKPDWPATGYGYIEFESYKKIKTTIPQKVVRFHEKPPLKTAELYLDLENMLWNIGVFCAKASVFIDEYKKVAPHIFKAVQQFVQGKGDYSVCENISVDHAVLEKSKAIYVLPVHFTWSDVGNLDIFLSLHTKHKKLMTNTIEIDSRNNVVEVPKKLVALIGVENLCIVETDDVLLISKRDQTDNVKQILHKLRKKNNHEYL